MPAPSRRPVFLLAIALSGLLAGAAAADPAFCEVTIGEEAVTLGYDAAEPDLYLSLREKHFLAEGDCPARVVLRHLTPMLDPEERTLFCLAPAVEGEGIAGISTGSRDAWGRCEQPARLCRFVNATAEEATALAGIAADSARAAGVQAVRDASGALILSGSTAGLTTAVSTAATGIGTTLSAPGVLAGAAASVVVVGGAVWACGG